MNILVTGGAGFIGSHLVKKLIKNKNNRVYVIIHKPNGHLWRLKEISNQITFLKYRAFEELPVIFKKHKFQLMIHLATHYVKETSNWKDINQMNQTNIAFPALLLQLAVNYRVPYFINTGSCFEYALGKKPVSENSPISPLNYYAATKIAFENILQYYCNKGFIKGVTLKLFYPYGELDNPKLAVLMTKSAIENHSLTLTKGEQKLNFTYIDDIVSAFIKTISFLRKKDSAGYEIINIGSNKTHSPKEMGKILEKISGRQNCFLFTNPYPENEILYCLSDNNKAYRILNWQAKTTLEQGLKRMYKYYSTNHD